MDATSSLTRRKPPAEALRGSTTLRLAVGSSKAELPLPRAVHRLSLLLNVIRRLGWLLITKGLPSALLLLRDALRAVLELVGALGARRAQFVCPARPPVRGIAPAPSPHHLLTRTHFGRAGKDDGSLRQYVRRHSLDFESRSPSGRLRRSSVDAIPSLDSISETPATADVAD